MAEVVTALKATRSNSEQAVQEIGALRTDVAFPASGRSQKQQGELLARIVSGALRRPLTC